jgi:DNA-binding transcriptional LysR family regulator
MAKEKLNYINILLEEGSFTDAAKRLNISQPALSTRVKKIEEKYGIEIFQRNRKPLVLSKEGQEYLEFFNEQNELERRFRMSVSDMRDLKKGSLRIGGTSLYTSVVLPKAVKEFSEKYPGIDVTICNGSVMELAEQAGKRHIDLYISSPGKKAKGIEYKPLVDMEMVMCVPAKLAEKAGLPDVNVEPGQGDWVRNLPYADMTKMANMPFAILNGNQQMGMMLKKLFRKYGIDPKHPIITDQALTAYSLANEGAAISLMYDRLVCRMPLQDGDIKYYRIDDEAARGPLYAAYPKEEDVPLAVEEFLKCFSDIMA